MTASHGPFGDVDHQADPTALGRGMRETGEWPAVTDLRRVTRPALEIASGGAVLDVGCGPADVLVQLAEMVRVTRPDGTVVAIDTDWRTVAIDPGDRRLESVLAGAIAVRPGAFVDAFVDATRRGRLHLSVSMFAVSGQRRT